MTLLQLNAVKVLSVLFLFPFFKFHSNTFQVEFTEIATGFKIWCWLANTSLVNCHTHNRFCVWEIFEHKVDSEPFVIVCACSERWVCMTVWSLPCNFLSDWWFSSGEHPLMSQVVPRCRGRSASTRRTPPSTNAAGSLPAPQWEQSGAEAGNQHKSTSKLWSTKNFWDVTPHPRIIQSQLAGVETSCPTAWESRVSSTLWTVNYLFRTWEVLQVQSKSKLVPDCLRNVSKSWRLKDDCKLLMWLWLMRMVSGTWVFPTSSICVRRSIRARSRTGIKWRKAFSKCWARWANKGWTVWCCPLWELELLVGKQTNPASLMRFSLRWPLGGRVVHSCES